VQLVHSQPLVAPTLGTLKPFLHLAELYLLRAGCDILIYVVVLLLWLLIGHELPVLRQISLEVKFGRAHQHALTGDVNPIIKADGPSDLWRFLSSEQGYLA